MNANVKRAETAFTLLDFGPTLLIDVDISVLIYLLTLYKVVTSQGRTLDQLNFCCSFDFIQRLPWLLY